MWVKFISLKKRFSFSDGAPYNHVENVLLVSSYLETTSKAGYYDVIAC